MGISLLLIKSVGVGALVCNWKVIPMNFFQI